MHRGATDLAGVRLDSLRDARLHQRRGAGARARRRARPAVDHAPRQTAGRGRRGSTLDIGARQSLRQPAAERSVAAEPLRRNCPSLPRWRCTTPSPSARRGSVPAVEAEMAERPAARRRQARRHPDRGRGEPAVAVVIGIGVNCVIASAATRRIRRPIWPRRRARPRPKHCSRRCRRRCAHGWRNGTRGDGFADIRADWLERAAGLGENIRCGCRSAN